jgi:hypothetical protein
MKKVIIIAVVLVLVGAGVYFWVIPKFYSSSSSEINKLASTTIAIPPESPPATGTNTQDLLVKVNNAFPSNKMLDVGATASNILKTMDYQAAQNLLPQISQCDPAFAEMQSVIDAEYNIGPADFRPDRKIPNLLPYQIMGKLLAVKGMGMENQGNLDKAVNNYLLAAQFGSVFAGKNTTLIQKLIAIALEKMAYNPLKQFVLRHPEDVNNLKRIIATLDKAEQKRLPISESFLSEKRTIQYMAQNFQQYAKTDKQIAALKLKESEIPRIIEESDKIYGYMITSYEMPYPQYMKEDPQSKLIEMLKAKEVHPLIAIAVPNFMEANVRNLTTATDNRLIRIMAAIELYHQDKQAYPSSLSELAPTYIAAVPKDYFSDSDFIYGTRDNSFYLYSVGPDMQDNQGQPLYDPTNGTTSAGDILGK